MNSVWYVENQVKPESSIGIDEVGRGPLAGPVVAAAVWLNDKAIAIIEKEDILIRDSKKLSSKQREKTVAWVKSQPKDILQYSIGWASVKEIDTLNILNATMLAMKRAFDDLDISVPLILVDGNKAPNFGDATVKTIVKGDSKVLSIALASIIAKEYRDNIMKDLAKKYPNYGWENNAGYGSQQHIYAIIQYGATPLHRKTFAPVKDLAKIPQAINEILNTLKTNTPNR